MRKVVIAAALLVAFATAASARPTTAHWCRQGDPPLYASARTSCRFAGKVVTSYANACHESRTCRMRVYSRAARKRYRITCRRMGTVGNGTVYCKGRAGSGIWTRFSSVI